MARIVPSALMLTPGRLPSDRERSSAQRSALDVPERRLTVDGHGCERSPVRSEGECPDLTTGLREGRADGGQVRRIPEPDALLVETEREQPSVGAEAPGVSVIAASGTRSCVKVKRRPSPRSPPTSQAIAVPS